MKWIFRNLAFFILFYFAQHIALAQTATLYHLGSVVGAYSTIKEAVSKVTTSIYSSLPFDSIVLSPHTFYEHDINISGAGFILKGQSTNGCKIDAEGKGRVFYSTAGNPSLIVEDVILQNGYTTGNGGGIYVKETSIEPVLILRGNTLLRSCYAKGAGGGIFATPLELKGNAKILNNISEYCGGGLYTSSMRAYDSVDISGNKAKYAGGAYMVNTTMFGNVKITNNYASINGGGIAGIFELNGTQVIGNKSGGVYNAIGCLFDITNPRLEDSIFGGAKLFNHCYFYNTDPDGSRDCEIYNYIYPAVNRTWFGESDTSNLIRTYTGSYSTFNYIVADWQLNRGKTLTAKDTVFPVQAGFMLNTGAALPSGSCPWLYGHFRATGGGSFKDSIVKISVDDTILSRYRSFISGPINKNIDFLAWVDADTFRTTRLVWGKDTSTKKDTTTGLDADRMNQLEVMVYPIPATIELHILNAPQDSKARLYDMAGRQVIYHPITSDNSIMPLHTLAAGYYILRITAANGLIATTKVQKE